MDVRGYCHDDQPSQRLACRREAAARRLDHRLARSGAILALALLLAGCGVPAGSAPARPATTQPPPGGMGPGSVVLTSETAGTRVAAPSPTATPRAAVQRTTATTRRGAQPTHGATPAPARPVAREQQPAAPVLAPPVAAAPPEAQAAPAVAAAPAPASPPRPAPTATSAAAIMYRVKRGETVYRIAKQHGVTVAEVLQANHMDDARKLRAGQLLRIPTAASGGVAIP